MVTVRPFQPRDTRQVERCFAELQDYERSLEDNRKDGAAISPAYLRHLRDLCRKWGGCILVAEQDGVVAGFVCVLAGFDSRDMIEARPKHAFVTDLVVTAALRGRGIGSLLLEKAEEFSRQHGATVMRLSVLAENRAARKLYRAKGFRELEIKLTKAL